MHARIATFEGGRPEDIEKVRKHIPETFIPQLRAMKGHAGMIQLADRDSGRGLSIVLFENEEALTAGDRELNAMSPPDDLSGTRRTSVEKYEVVLHQVDGDPAAARLSRLEGSPGRIDEGIRFAEENILPRARGTEGWSGIFGLADRQTGKLTLITLWESTEALRASEELANRLRQESADTMGHKIAGVERYEVLGIDVPVRAGSR